MLESLYAGSIADAAEREETVSLSQIEKLALDTPPAINALAHLAPREQVQILAEVKRASPSKGNLAQIEDPAALAEIYANNGASAVSVLTEQRKFLGSLQDFAEVRSRVAVPLLRKDFIANEYQILEARAFGADLILLIVAGLEQKRIFELKNFTEALGMTAFIETHSSDEVKRALDLDAKFVGVNARDLSTFETDRNLFAELAHLFPVDVIKVAESAVRTVADVAHYRESGADVVLVGEALVTGDPATMLQEFLSVGLD